MCKLFILVVCLTYLSLTVSTDTEKASLRKTAKKLKENLILKYELTCTNYENFCEGPDVRPYGSANLCKEGIAKDLLCKNPTAEESKVAANEETEDKIQETP